MELLMRSIIILNSLKLFPYLKGLSCTQLVYFPLDELFSHFTHSYLQPSLTSLRSSSFPLPIKTVLSPLAQTSFATKITFDLLITSKYFETQITHTFPL